MFRFVTGTFKIAAVSLMAGAGLSVFDLTAEQVLGEIGLTQDRVLELAQAGAAWAAPNLLLGSMVVVPLWLVMLLLRPPRG
ncbi:MAG: DUF6460 domain-containing protein [Rhizobiaceae bacterium]